MMAIYKRKFSESICKFLSLDSTTTSARPTATTMRNKKKIARDINHTAIRKSFFLLPLCMRE
jgi:hypothetical protein